MSRLASATHPMRLSVVHSNVSWASRPAACVPKLPTYSCRRQTDRDPKEAPSRDEMLDQIGLYWLTDTAASSAPLYFEQRAPGPKNRAGTIDLRGRAGLVRELFDLG